MFEPLAEVGKWLVSLLPLGLRTWRPKLNYITVHYLYMIGMSIVISVVLYGGGLIPYIDALFFAAGAATQSGLNTININELKLYQQIAMFFVANICNPIFINTIVVFVRLYWFEKRFTHVVREIREQRRSRVKTMSRSKSEMRDPVEDPHRLELGVNGRHIRVLHETTQPNGMSGTTAPANEDAEKFKEKMGIDTNVDSVEPSPEGSNKSSGEDGENDKTAERGRNQGHTDAVLETPMSAASEHHLGLNPKLHREITFADEVQTPEHNDETHPLATVPDQQDVSKHISFLERQQRNAREGSVLHIPGPRAFDRGEVPRQMDSDEELNRPQTRNSLQPIKSEGEREGMNTEGEVEMNLDDHHEPGAVRFDEQEHPGRQPQTDTFESAGTTSSRFGMHRIKSGVSSVLRRRRSNSNNLHSNNTAPRSMARTFSNLTAVMSRERPQDPMPYLSWQATTGRNSAFLGLSEEQREELGGIEYRSLKTLAKVLMIYFVGFHTFGMVINLPWIMFKNHWKQMVIKDGIDPGWWGVFTSASLFNDLGFTLTPNSMISFQQATTVLLIGSFLIIIGNTGFPIMLRFVIWMASKIVPYGSGTWEELKFLLDHPRRCFTLLFPSKATWWLFWILVLLNVVDLVFFVILDLNDPAVTHLPPGFRVLDGWFQAASTRTAGFSCVNLAKLHPAIQVSYMIMMYISVFPIAISVRRTNVYEEKSLGLWGGEEDGSDGEDPSYVGQHLRRQLSFDLWYIFLGLFVICIVEGDRLSNSNDWAFTIYSVLFEITSAYGTVGLSLGYPGTDMSFSAQFKTISKLVIIAMMIRGRHRGLPYALDRAILLPSENLQKKEAEDADRRHRRGSIFSEGHEAERLRSGLTWSQTEIDEHGLPRQHVAHAASARDAAMTAGAGHPGNDQSPERTRTVRRRASGMSTSSAQHRRSRSLARVFVGGLSAGPTLPKED